MKISNKVTEPLGRLIAGDTGSAPYLSGPKLVSFYNGCGFDDVYEGGFPSRWRYLTDKIIACNGTSSLKKILEDFIDPRRFDGDEELVDAVAAEVNQLIKYDGFSLIKNGGIYKVANIKGSFIEAEVVSTIGHDFIKEQIQKCQQKIASEDFNGAITNARTLCEAVFIHIIEVVEGVEVKNDGNIMNLWSRVKKALKIDLSKDEVPDFIFQILSGLSSSVNGLAGLSNNASDRHANKFNTKRHHAKLAVNSTMTLCDFLIDVFNERSRKAVVTKQLNKS